MADLVQAESGRMATFQTSDQPSGGNSGTLSGGKRFVVKKYANRGSTTRSAAM
jgi:hypothetical protein